MKFDLLHLSISLTKHKLSLVVALFKVLSKFLTRILHRSIQALERSITQRATTGTKPVFPWAAFSALEGLGDNSNLILRIICGYTVSSALVSLSG